MTLVALLCPICGGAFAVQNGAHNRAVGRGAREYCGRACAGVARRSEASKPDRVAAKAAYDVVYRAARAGEIKAAKAAPRKATYDPAKQWLAYMVRM